MFELSGAGGNKDGQSFDVFTKAGKFAGLVVESYTRGVRVYFDGNATRGSKRVFASVHDALGFIHDRRIKKGWSV